MKRKFTKLGIGFLIVVLLIALSVGVFALDGEYTRDVTVHGLSITANGQTITGVLSDPVDYWEVAGGGSLTDYDIIYDTIYDVDPIIYTGYYPDTPTGRVGNFIEYVCEKQDTQYVVTKINTSGDGKTYIPLNGFVFSIEKSLENATNYLKDFFSKNPRNLKEHHAWKRER